MKTLFIFPPSDFYLIFISLFDGRNLDKTNKMSQSLNVLIVDDEPEDAELIARELKKSGFNPQWRRVDTEGGYLASMTPLPQVIICDYHMPQFNPYRAMDLLKALGLEIPFIVVTRTLGDEKTAEVMRHGAADYLLKDRLARLGKAVEAALEKQKLAQRAARASTVLERSEASYRILFESAVEAIYQATLQGRFLTVNPAMAQLLGYDSPEDLVLTVIDLHQQIYADPSFASELIRQLEKTGEVRGFEAPFVKKDKKLLWVSQHVRSVLDERGKILYYQGFASDVTELRHLREELEDRSREVDSLLEDRGYPKKYNP